MGGVRNERNLCSVIGVSKQKSCEEPRRTRREHVAVAVAIGHINVEEGVHVNVHCAVRSKVRVETPKRNAFCRKRYLADKNFSRLHDMS